MLWEDYYVRAYASMPPVHLPSIKTQLVVHTNHSQKRSQIHCSREVPFPAHLALPPPSSARMNDVRKQEKQKGRGGGGGSGGGGRLARMLREHRARLYIIRRCVVMLLCHHD